MVTCNVTQSTLPDWLNRLRLHTKYRYKAAISDAAHAFEWDVDDELSQAYL